MHGAAILLRGRGHGLSDEDVYVPSVKSIRAKAAYYVSDLEIPYDARGEPMLTTPGLLVLL